MGLGAGVAVAAPAPRCARGATRSRVVSDVAGLHAQVFSSAELTLWARVEASSRAGSRDALWERRTLVKTWAMRGHAAPAARRRARPLRRRARAAAPAPPRARVAAPPRAHPRAGRRDAGRGRRTLLGGGPLTREALARAVGERLGDPALAERLGGGFGDLLKPAAFTGDLCFAPNDGRLVRFTRPADWLAGFAPPGPDEAAAEDVVRALPARVRPGAARAVPALVRDDVAGRGGALDQGARGRGRRGRRRGRARLDARRRRRAGRGVRSRRARSGCCRASTTT